MVYCTISINSAVTRHTDFFLTPDLVFSWFVRFFLRFIENTKKSCDCRIDRNGPVPHWHFTALCRWWLTCLSVCMLSGGITQWHRRFQEKKFTNFINEANSYGISQQNRSYYEEVGMGSLCRRRWLMGSLRCIHWKYVEGCSMPTAQKTGLYDKGMTRCRSSASDHDSHAQKCLLSFWALKTRNMPRQDAKAALRSNGVHSTQVVTSFLCSHLLHFPMGPWDVDLWPKVGGGRSWSA